MSWHDLFFLAVLTAVAAVPCSTAVAQEITPRAYWPLPKGTNVFVVAYQYSAGDIVTDQSLPITGVDSNIDYLQLTYQRTFSLLGRSANAQLSLPFSDGVTDGFVDGVYRRRRTSGVMDARARLSVNLAGAPSMDGAGFQMLRKNPRTIVGVSLLIQAPTGEYEADKLINLGTNRWSVKPAIGVIWPMRPTWLLEAEIGVWIFEDNDEFLGATRQQDPVVSTEVHLVKRIQPGFWASLDANFYAGGRTTVGETTQADLQRNSRIGATVVFPIKGKHAVRSSFSTGAVTRSGGDYDVFTLSYLYAW